MEERVLYHSIISKLKGFLLALDGIGIDLNEVKTTFSDEDGSYEIEIPVADFIEKMEHDATSVFTSKMKSEDKNRALKFLEMYLDDKLYLVAEDIARKLKIGFFSQ